MSLPDPTVCHMCRDRPGERHAYYYGRRTSPWWSLRPTYDVLGEAEVVLCDACRPAARRLQRRYAQALWWAAVGQALVVGHAGVSEWRAMRRPGYAMSTPWEWWVGPLLYTVAIGLAVCILARAVLQARALRRDPIAALVRDAGTNGLAADAVDTVLLPEEYDRLVRQGRIRRVPQGL